jgi:predicted ATPase
MAIKGLVDMPAAKNLDRIEIDGFKSIREMKLELGRLNLLIGANGAGKSNLVSVFGLLNQIVEGRLQSAIAKVGASSLLHNGPKRTDHIRLKLAFGLNTYQAQLGFGQDDSLFFSEKTCTFDGQLIKGRRDFSFGSGHKETQLPERAKKNGIALYVLNALRSWSVYHFHDTSPEAAAKRKGPIDDNERLRPDAANLAAFLYRLRETQRDSYRQIVAAIRQVAPFFADFRLNPDRIRQGEIQLEWSEKNSDTYFNAHSLSDGTLRFICLATLLLQPVLPSLILIDEPELGLHPYAVTQLAALFKSAATRAQLLVATQSVTLVNQFGPEDVVVVDRKDGQSTFERIGPEEINSWTDSYALGELWEKNVIGGRPQR